MTKPQQSFHSLKGQFLIAMPQIDDLRFEKAVIYLYEHTPQGAAGIVINRPAERMSFVEILKQLKIKHEQLVYEPTIVLGGPDKFTNGFILHTSDYEVEGTQHINPDICLTATQDILYDISQGIGPSKSLISLGCATWISGQLEDEIMSNVWLTAPADKMVIFDVPFSKRWHFVLNKMGIQSHFLSTECGKA
ncbi:MAG: YqgE/AlgH family protein [Alphaproteobacteria bacterium]|nr:YqgE/AlgH family protein [Alphaproteobacteria bacterium]